jgi:hypothetical protein
MHESDPTNAGQSFSIENLTDSRISQKKRPGKLFESENLHNKIIRVEQADELLHKHNNRLELTELVQEAENLFGELENKYGVNIPFDDYRIGKDKSGNDIVYCVVDRIDGKHLEEVGPSIEFSEQAETLYTSIAKYFLDKFEEGGLYLWDINGQSQYIYGKKAGEQEDKIYLIDTDIWMSRSHAGIYLTLEWLTRHMSGVERHVNRTFKKAREYIRQIICKPIPEEMSESDRNTISQNIDNISRFLNREKIRSGSKNAIPPFE